METMVDDAREWLIHNAKKCAMAKARRVFAIEYKKSLKAILFQEYEGTVAERDAAARSNERYLKHLEEIRQAVYEDEHLNALKKAAEIKIDIWRTEQATQRAAKI